MPHPWTTLLRLLGRHALVVVGVVVVLLSSVQINCLLLQDDAGLAVVEAPMGDLPVLVDDGAGRQGDPLDPDACGHCHCVAPAAIVTDQGMVIPSPLVGRSTPIREPGEIPTGVSFAPDTPPNRA
jgi:hypothetical protein